MQTTMSPASTANGSAKDDYSRWWWMLDCGATEQDVDMLRRACLTMDQAKAAVIEQRWPFTLRRRLYPDIAFSTYELGRLVGLVALAQDLCSRFGDDRAALVAYWHRKPAWMMGLTPAEVARHYDGIGALRSELAIA